MPQLWWRAQWIYNTVLVTAGANPVIACPGNVDRPWAYRRVKILIHNPIIYGATVKLWFDERGHLLADPYRIELGPGERFLDEETPTVTLYQGNIYAGIVAVPSAYLLVAECLMVRD